MAYVKIMIHAVWGTKNRFPFLTKKIRQTVIDHIMMNARTKEIFIDRHNASITLPLKARVIRPALVTALAGNFLKTIIILAPFTETLPEIKWLTLK